MIKSLGNRLLIIFLIIALLSGCSIAKKQIVPQDVDPAAILHGIYNFENIKSVKSVSQVPLNEISKLADDIDIHYQYAFMVKGAVDQQNNPFPDMLYVIAAIENRREHGEMDIYKVEGNINGNYSLLRPRYHLFDVNVCYGKTKSECNPKKHPPYEAIGITFELDKFKDFRPKKKNTVNIEIGFAFGKSKNELRGNFFNDAGPQKTGGKWDPLELPADFN
ncbi:MULTISPECIES: hypothetical protein [Paenibacillus]|nr:MULTISPECIES: hypothetical protein [Paenibacillus]